MGISTLSDLFMLLASSFPVLSERMDLRRRSKPIPFKTIEQGDISYYGFDDASFAGLEALIRDQETWKAFWAAHSGVTKAASIPDIDFDKEMVIAVIQGNQRTAGPIVDIVQVLMNSQRELRVLIEDDQTPDLLVATVNPFHIVKLNKHPLRSVVYEHRRPVGGEFQFHT